LFWLFLGGFCWVVGDLFQQYATKYIGIGRGIPLSNTNQLWGLAWGALVFGELAGVDSAHALLVVAGSITMILGALAIGSAEASSEEHQSTDRALQRECDQYGLDYHSARMAQLGQISNEKKVVRRWWDYLIVVSAVGIFVALGRWARIPEIPMDLRWSAGLTMVTLLFLAYGGWRLWRETRFQ
jgi:hypothetical protein